MIRISAFLLAWLGLASLSLQAQVTGISYQAVILSPDGKALPGKNQASAPLANQEICLKFSFKTDGGTTGVVEYEETHVIETDAYGMVNLTLGLGTPVGGTFASFDLIPWISGTKFLEVNLGKSGTCANYTMLSDQAFTAVPFALYAVNSPPGPQGPAGAVGAPGPPGPVGPAATTADLTGATGLPLTTGVTGILPLANGGTGSSTQNFVDLSTNQTVGGVKTFANPITGNITGNAATVTTNANLIGPVTSIGNATAIANGAITNAMLANTAVANLTGTNTGDQTAATVSSVPAGSISATNVQAALNELGTEKAPLASPTFTGTPSLPTGTIAVTQGPANNSTALATTAYVDNAASTVVTAASTAILGTAGILPVTKGGTGASTLTGYVKGDGTNTMTATTTIPVVDVVGAAPLASPNFTGTPTAVTQSATDNSTALATTEFVSNAASTAVTTASTAILGTSGILPVTKGGTGASTLTGYVKGDGTNTMTAITTIPVADVVGAAPLASPNFTGTPTAVTQGPANNSTALATTAYVDNAASTAVTEASTTILGVSGILPVSKGGTGASNLTGYVKGDGTNTMTATTTIPVSDVVGAAPLASPNFTGTPTAITQSATDNSTALATTEFVSNAASTAVTTASTAILGTSGILPVTKGGTGASTLTGYVKGDGTNTMTATATIPVTDGGTGLNAAGTKGQVLTSTGSGLAWSVTYSVGYHAELGGYVFYVTPDGDHGLVVATVDQNPTSCTWFVAQNVVSNQANYTDTNPIHTSVKKFTDWRLPTIHELELLIGAIDDGLTIPAFGSDFYWSSTISDYNRSWTLQVTAINPTQRTWDISSRVRAVRSF